MQDKEIERRIQCTQCKNESYFHAQKKFVAVNELDECTNLTHAWDTAFDKAIDSTETKALIKGKRRNINEVPKNCNEVIKAEYFKQLIQYVRHGEIKKTTMGLMASIMDPCVFGEFKINSSDNNSEPEDLFRAILKKWYKEVLFELSDEEKYDKLINILEHEDVNLKYLAHDIKSFK